MGVLLTIVMIHDRFSRIFFHYYPILEVQAAQQQQLQVQAPVTEACLGCICEAMSECKKGTQCEGGVCGLFR